MDNIGKLSYPYVAVEQKKIWCLYSVEKIEFEERY